MKGLPEFSMSHHHSRVSANLRVSRGQHQQLHLYQAEVLLYLLELGLQWCLVVVQDRQSLLEVTAEELFLLHLQVEFHRLHHLLPVMRVDCPLLLPLVVCRLHVSRLFQFTLEIG